MKTRLVLLIASAGLLALILIGVLVVVPKLKPRDLFFGTFTNASMPVQKSVRFPGGYKDYRAISDTVPIEEGTEQIVDQWTDSEGNAWYKTRASMENSKYLTLQRISRSGTLLELAINEVVDFASGDFPARIDPAGPVYRIYYRTSR